MLFNGILVGEVTGLKLDPKQPKQVAATISIDKNVEIHSDADVGLEFQGLTGVAQVSIKGGTTSAPVLVGSKTDPPSLTAPPAATMDFTQAARDTLRRLDDFVADNQSVFKDALKNIDTFTAALARNSDRIDKITQGLQELTGGEDGKSGKVNEAVDKISDAVKSYKTLADNLDKRTADDRGRDRTPDWQRRNKQIEIVGADHASHAGHDRHGGKEFRQESEPADLRRQRQQQVDASIRLLRRPAADGV